MSCKALEDTYIPSRATMHRDVNIIRIVKDVNSTQDVVARMWGGDVKVRYKKYGKHPQGVMALNKGLGSATAIIEDGWIVTLISFKSHGLISCIENENSHAKTTSRMKKGSILTGGTFSHGIYSPNLGLGPSEVIMDAGQVRTFKYGSSAILSWIGNPNSLSTANSIIHGGRVMTKGDEAYGIVSRSRGLGDVKTVMEGGEIRTRGKNSFGVFAWHTNELSTATAEAFMNGGKLNTEGDFSDGLTVFHQGLGLTNVTMKSGEIKTVGINSKGIHARIMNRNSKSIVTATMKDGTITTNGNGYSEGLVASNQGLGETYVNMEGGKVKTTGVNAKGVYGLISNANSESIVSVIMKGGSIETENDKSQGLVSMNEGKGVTTVSLEDGEIMTFGQNSHGVYSKISNMKSTNTAMAMIKDGTIITNGSSTKSVYADNKGLGETYAFMQDGNIQSKGNQTVGVCSNISNKNSKSKVQTKMYDGNIVMKGEINTDGIVALNEGLGETSVVLEKGSITINGSNSHGIYSLIKNNTSSALATTNMNDGDIITKGDSSHGISTEHEGLGAVYSMLNHGKIMTVGNMSNGVLSYVKNINSQSKAMTIMKNGEVETEGNKSEGIAAYNNGSGEALVKLEDGSIRTKGEKGIGIYSHIINNKSKATAQAIMKNGIVKTDHNDSQGVFSKHDGLGHVHASLQNTGKIITHGKSSHGIYAHINNYKSEAEATVMMEDGTLDIKGNKSHGLLGRNDGIGAIYMSFKGGKITTTGNHSSGLNAQIHNVNSVGDQNILMKNGSIKSEGVNSYGLLNLSEGLGIMNVVMENGKIDTSGLNAHGIYVNKTNQSSKSLVMISITGGKIQTTGKNAQGLFTSNDGLGETSVVIENGFIKTSGENSKCAYLRINNSDSDARGIINMKNGDLSTESKNSQGIFAVNEGLGEIKVNLDGGYITTENVDSHGIYAKISNVDSKNSVITSIKDGKITTNGINAQGILSINDGLGTNRTIMNSGMILTSNKNSKGIFSQIKNNSSKSMISISMKEGSINTASDYSEGLLALNEGLGETRVFFEEGKIITSGKESHVIYAHINNPSSMATVMSVIKKGQAETTGNVAPGILVKHEGLGNSIAFFEGNMKTIGLNSHAIYVTINNDISKAHTLITMQDGIAKTEGDYAQGLRSYNNGLGEAKINLLKGKIWTTGQYADGIYTSIINKKSTALASTIMKNGSIETKGNHANGLTSHHNGLGNAEIYVTDGKITTLGFHSGGVLAKITNSNSKRTVKSVITDTSIKTDGHSASGVLSYNEGFGLTNITIKNSDIKTSGNHSNGIFAQISNSIAKTNKKKVHCELNKECSEASIFIQKSEIETHGLSSHGIYFQNNQDENLDTTVTLKNSKIILNGENSNGIYINNLSNKELKVYINGNSYIESGSGDSSAIRMINVDNTGLIHVDKMAVIDGSASGTAMKLSKKDVSHNKNKIFKIISSGQLIGDSILGLGNDIFHLVNGSVNGKIIGDMKPDSKNKRNKNWVGLDVDRFNWTAGIIHNGGFLGQYGEDEATISSREYDGTQLLDGGGGFNDIEVIDILNIDLKNSDLVTVDKNMIVNWERININGGRIGFKDGRLKTGTGFREKLINGESHSIPLGIHILKNGILDGLSEKFELTGNMTLNSKTATFEGTGGGHGLYTIKGNIKNNGRITTIDGSIGDKIQILGNYTGNGSLELDIETETGMADELIIKGNVSGKTKIKLKNRSKTKSSSKEITLVHVHGNSIKDNYILINEVMTDGAFGYALDYQEGRYFLSAALNSTGAIYASTPVILSRFNQLPSFYQRVGSQNSFQNKNGDGYKNSWMRVYGDQGKMVQKNSSQIKRSFFGLQSGLDISLMEYEKGQVTLGITGQFSHVNGKLNHGFGSGQLNSNGYGVGASATWEQGIVGNYLDLQGQINWIDSDFSSSAVEVELASGVRSMSMAISVESGRRIRIKNRKQYLIPQAQLTWGRIQNNPFQDNRNNDIDLSLSDTLMARIGMIWENKSNVSNKNYYAIGNMVHYFSEESNVEVAGSNLHTEGESGTWIDWGFGGSISLNPRITLFLEASYRSPISKGVEHVASYGVSTGSKICW